MIFLPYNKKLSYYSRELRTNQTKTELLLWAHIRKRQILDIQFYRQKIIENFIVDFYAPAVKLVIEIDGAQHFEAEMMIQDMNRDAILHELGLKVLRYDNYQVKNYLSSVLEDIYEYVHNYSR